ncbi:helix-turn-helix transcriptional regulator [Eggerthella sinensis]|uniref:HTH luxR-type domain-containing protein n=1 Tax=Eggerthella sinensis TaxID=242230 RepID=A0A3N0ISZ3_9ACTN|nr:helix-turn-helix transcriptional regulator [Eggerthella sinensis]RDB68990.1 hypothetical protein C1876_08550 [Eggerthella sinensis]RNM40108.1 hypothetical protein DMP09_15815 [Eggerthella sinensis]
MPQLQNMTKRDWMLAACTVVGLAFMSVWSDVVGHGSGFFASADAVQDIANARVLFLAGLTLSTAFYVLAPKALKRFEAPLGIGVATASLAATLLFSFPSLAPLLPVDYLCAGCLFFVGVGYGWLAVHLVCEVAYQGDYGAVVSILAISLLAKTIMTSLFNLHGSAAVQVGAAIVSPVVAFAAVWAGQRLLDRSPETLDLAELPKVQEPDKRVLLVLLVLLPVLRALVRVLSKMGFWGSGYEVENILNGLGFLIVIALVLFFARVTLVKEQGDDLITRFLPPFMVILGGFFLLDPQVAHLVGITAWTSYLLTTFVELFSQLFHWALIALSIRSLSIHPYRVVGIGYAVYGAFSIAYALLLQNTVELSSVLIVLAMYFFIVVMMLLFRSRRTGAAPKADAGATRQPSSDEERLRAIAERYGLSPRETEVFALLAQGRNRTYIQNALFLAEGTVKTHTSRIYQKLGVNNRQDMITLVQDADS